MDFAMVLNELVLRELGIALEKKRKFDHGSLCTKKRETCRARIAFYSAIQDEETTDRAKIFSPVSQSKLDQRAHEGYPVTASQA